MENSTGGHGSNGATRAGRRSYHKWKFVSPGISFCVHCKMRRTYVKYHGSKWKVYYRRLGDKQMRPVGDSRKVPKCRRTGEPL